MNSTSEPTLTNRDLRQRDLVPPQRLAECHALVIGVGAIGRQVALQLAAIGVPRLTLYDHDTVQVENLAPQGYWCADLELTKVRATGSVCLKINPDLKLTLVPERFKRSTARDLPPEGRLAVFVCVDSIACRQLIWEALKSQAAFFVDGRMSAEVIRVLAVAEPATDGHYASTLFQSEQAYSGSCTRQVDHLQRQHRGRPDAGAVHALAAAAAGRSRPDAESALVRACGSWLRGRR